MAAWLLLLLLPSCLTTDSPRVKTAIGWVQGSHKVSEPGRRKFAAYEGIPYAVPPIERLRFQPPMKTTSHEDNFHPPSRPLQATQPPPECPQVIMVPINRGLLLSVRAADLYIYFIVRSIQ